MQIDQLETFLAIVTYGGFHKAAEALHVSQPAISGRVRALGGVVARHPAERPVHRAICR